MRNPMTRVRIETIGYAMASCLLAAALAASLESAPVRAQGMTLDVCPNDYSSFPEDAPSLTCGCSAAAVKAGRIMGTNPYYWQSSLCRAAVHAGAIAAQGGQIVVKPKKAPFFPAVSRNGVAGDSYGGGMGFEVVVPGQPATQPATRSAAADDKSGMTLDVCPTDYSSFPEDAPSLTCGCSAAAVKAGRIMGTNPYYWQSSLCRAAVHAGAVAAQGGQIVVKPKKAPFFPAVSRNGVAGDSYGGGMGFEVVVPGQPATQPATRSAAADDKSGMTLDVCPTDYSSFPEDAPSLTCGCSATAVKAGRIMGTNPYYWQSSLCRAAVHAGAIGAQGGEIVVKPKKAPFFPAVSRNGVAGDSYIGGMGFEVVVQGQPATQSAAADDKSGMTLDVCPTDYSSFPEDAPSLTCGCSAAAVKAGRIMGTNPYYWQSSLCRAAVHAGAVAAQGGQIVVKPKKAPFFPAVSRNGVAADSYGGGMGFEVVVAPRPAPAPVAPAPPATTDVSARPSVDMTGKPIQAPVAKTLRETGRVQLYINFATDQQKPLPSSEPVLAELLATLQGDQTLRIELVGHTDSQGGAPYNLDLSQRRAAAIYLWLIQHGVDSDRLRSAGHGLMEPIADNSTEWGRALNRRVEAKAIK